MLRSSLSIISTLIALTSSLPLGQAIADEMRPATAGESGRITATAKQPMLSVRMTLDFAKVLTFDRPARTVIIGNPGIVDGVLNDEKSIVLTGKALGSTNMIILGQAGEEIANLIVNVSANSQTLTTVHLGMNQQVFSCSEACKPLQAATPK